MLEVRKRPQPCQGCGSINDALSGTVEPGPRDVSVCIKCGHVAVVGDDYLLRELTPEEAVAVLADARILEIQQAIRRAKEKFNAHPR